MRLRGARGAQGPALSTPNARTPPHPQSGAHADAVRARRRALRTGGVGGALCPGGTAAEGPLVCRGGRGGTGPVASPKGPVPPSHTPPPPLQMMGTRNRRPIRRATAIKQRVQSSRMPPCHRHMVIPTNLSSLFDLLLCSARQTRAECCLEITAGQRPSSVSWSVWVRACTPPLGPVGRRGGGVRSGGVQSTCGVAKHCEGLR